ncbi:MAG: RNA polymerase sigma-54 factor, partial [Prolixibacteraceae bacterium]|nr:RNA polymerase sigma-54 factor [Prolixibacteraceae bacterium]
MEQKLTLQQKLLQKLSPQQIQVIKLLEIPTMQLEQRIKKELEENPVLELASDNPSTEEEGEAPELRSDEDADNEEFTLDDYFNDEEIPTYKLNVKNYSPDDKNIDIPFSIGKSFHEFLDEQLGMAYLSEYQKTLSEFIIGNIDEDGYLRRDLISISDDLAFSQNMDVEVAELDTILKIIHDFDPPGVGARNLQECLLLQLKRKKGPAVEIAIFIIKDYYDEFTKKHYEKIQRKLELSDEQLKEAIDEILKL